MNRSVVGSRRAFVTTAGLAVGSLSLEHLHGIEDLSSFTPEIKETR